MHAVYLEKTYLFPAVLRHSALSLLTSATVSSWGLGLLSVSTRDFSKDLRDISKFSSPSINSPPPPPPSLYCVSGQPLVHHRIACTTIRC